MKKFIFLALFAIVAVTANAQLDMYNGGTTYTLDRVNSGSIGKIDTVTNTGHGELTSRRLVGAGAIGIQINVTKVSGTVGGTITVKGSLDGTNFVALNTEETQTALATKTAADASGSYHWRLSRNQCAYYQISWTGTGTMVATFTAQIIKQ